MSDLAASVTRPSPEDIERARDSEFYKGFVAGYAAAERQRNTQAFTTWRGVCGHLWDRLTEDTDECPRCAELAVLTMYQEAVL